MEAQVARAYAPIFVALMESLISPLNSFAASHRTPNFIVTARTKALAVEIGEAAERYRSQLAIEWLGHELPTWSQPCPVEAKVDRRLGAGGATSFMFETSERHFGRPVTSGDGLFQARPQGRPFGWEMSLQGSRERVPDSVLPHEVTHTIFATHFGGPLPRWADEGACTTVEHDSERKKQALQWVLRTRLTMDEISYNLGFNHVTGFHSAFQRWTGQAPSKYRKSHCLS